MNTFTHETIDRTEQYETYEWDNVWIDHADAPQKRRVLYIGDSISCGTRHVATARSGESILFDGFGTSKAVDNPWFAQAIRLFAEQEGRRDAILFNNGLHGYHLNDETEYPRFYEEIISFLRETYPETPLLIVLTTHVTNAENNARVMARNRAAVAIAEKYGLPVVDLYGVSEQAEELMMEDGVHFLAPGYEKLADAVIEAVNACL